MYTLGCIPEAVYLILRGSHTLIHQLQHPPFGLSQSSTDFFAIGGVKKASFLYQVFPKVKSIFTPGVATRLLVVNIYFNLILTCIKGHNTDENPNNFANLKVAN